MDVVNFAIKLLGIKSECIAALRPYLCGARVMTMADVFAEDPMCAAVTSQYMIGDKVMVVQVKEGASEIGFYLPRGTWTDIVSGEEYRGMTYVRRAVEGGNWPILAFEDAILPLKGDEYRVYTLKEQAFSTASDENGNVLSSLRATRLIDGMGFEAVGDVTALIVNAALAVKGENCTFTMEKDGIRVFPDANVQTFRIWWY